jgi:hypothetical protein
METLFVPCYNFSEFTSLLNHLELFILVSFNCVQNLYAVYDLRLVYTSTCCRSLKGISTETRLKLLEHQDSNIWNFRGFVASQCSQGDGQYTSP